MQTIVDTADGADALWLNQLYSIASGGDFWQSGGGISTAGSSTDVTLSISEVTVNIDGESITHGTQPVTHSATSGEYRTDVIYADSAGVDVQEGVEMPKLPQDKQFPSIWQPAPDNGSLVPGVPLWVVHITPEDAASGDIGSWQWQNRRMNAEVIDTDAVVSLLEEHSEAVGIDITGESGTASKFAGWDLTQFRRANALYISTTADGTQSADHLHIPDGFSLRLWRAGVVDANDAAPADTLASIYEITGPGGTNRIHATNGQKSVTYTQEFDGPTTVNFTCEDNSGGGAEDPTAHFVFTIEPQQL